MDNLQTIAQLFAERIFVIPDYQRGYAWEAQQCQELIEDLALLPEGKQHFFGTLVLQKRDGADEVLFDRGGRTYRRYEIIDGQQRLTTVIMFLHAIHQAMCQLGGNTANLTDDLQRNYLWTVDRNKRPLAKLTLNQGTQPLFQHLIMENDDSLPVPNIQAGKRLLAAHAFLSNYLQKEQEKQGAAFSAWLEALYFKIVHHLLLVVYAVQSEAEAGIIFETMNNRGKPLTELEKVKNYLLYLAGRLHLPDPHDLGEQINRTWQHIYERFTVVSLTGRGYEDQLLRAHWLMAYDYQTQNWDGSRSIKNHFDLRDYVGRHDALLMNLQTYLNSLVSATTAYCDIQRPSFPGAFAHVQSQPELRNKIIATSDRLVRVGSLASFLPLLVAARIKQTPELYLQLVDLSEKYAFRVYRWSRHRSNKGQSRLYQMGYDLYQGREGTAVLDDIRRAILKYCPDTALEGGFVEGADWYHWAGLKYFLYEYEQHLAQTQGLAVRMPWELLTQKKDSIEHIMPKTPGGDGYWQSHFTPETHQHWLHDIGNLTLTYDNSKLSNRPFPAKQAMYAESPLFIERQIKDYPEWTEIQLRERREAIRAWALKRWQVPPPAPPKGGAGTSKKRKHTPERIKNLATQNGVGEIYDKILAISAQYGLGSRAWVNCITLSPPQNRRYALVYIEPKSGRLNVGIWMGNFPKFFGITVEEIQAVIGSDYWFQVDEANVEEFLSMLETLYQACGLTIDEQS